jgi:hypothetical protein
MAVHPSSPRRTRVSPEWRPGHGIECVALASDSLGAIGPTLRAIPATENRLPGGTVVACLPRPRAHRAPQVTTQPRGPCDGGGSGWFWPWRRARSRWWRPAASISSTWSSAIYLDFVFLFFYGLALSTGSLWARRQFKGGVGSRLGIPVATAAVVAAVLDIVENLSMLGYLNGWADWSGWIPLARVVAIPKFLLVLISITYVLIGVGFWAFRSLTSREHRE